jgi:hypothetical protein
MGSQNVTDFSQTKKTRIRDAIKQYASASPVPEQAWLAATTAIGPLTKSNPFVQSLSSPSVSNALDLLISLAEDFSIAKRRSDLEEVLQKHHVDPNVQKPLVQLAAEMTKSLSNRLTDRQEETDSAFAAKDAVAKTVIDVLSETMPREKVDSASPEQISKAFEKVGQNGIAEIFFRNILSSLMRLAFDSARGRVSPNVVAQIVEDASGDMGLAAEISREIVKLSPNNPAQITVKLEKRRESSKPGKPVLKPGPFKGDMTADVINGSKK